MANWALMVLYGPRARVVASAVVVAAAIGFSACGGSDAPSEDPGEVTPSGTSFDVKVGDTFTIALSSNATTGYAWALEKDPDSTVVVLVGDRYVVPESSAVGSGGVQQLSFKAQGAGSTTIELWYVRSFDNPPEPARQAQFPVVVTGG
jgi:predicted secreted protein